MKLAIKTLLLILTLLALSSCGSKNAQNNLVNNHKQINATSEHSTTPSAVNKGRRSKNDSNYYLQIAEAQGVMFFVYPIW